MFKKVIVLAIFGLAIAGCGMEQKESETPVSRGGNVLTVQQKHLAGVETGAIEFKLVSSTVSCTGEIEVPPQGMASVTAPLGGYIVQTRMVPGAQVRKGAVLATLSNPEYIVLQQRYLETAGELTFAEQDYRRQKMLHEQDANAVKKFQESESSFKVLKARLAGLREQLKMIGVDMNRLEAGNIQSTIQLRSPITGFITEVNHHPGQFVEPSEVIFELVDMRDLHVHLNVFEQDISTVRKGQAIRFRPSGGGEYAYQGSVSLVSPKKNLDEKTFDVHGHIESEDNQLKPGMFVEAEILISDDSVYALPEKALVYNRNKPLVLIEEGGQYIEQSVETGAKMDGWVEIVNHHELQQKKIVTQGATRLFTAMRK
jgi:cobalt-zinc-cadmium efflux system membrane fusion protein